MRRSKAWFQLINVRRAGLEGKKSELYGGVEVGERGMAGVNGEVESL